MYGQVAPHPSQSRASSFKLDKIGMVGAYLSSLNNTWLKECLASLRKSQGTFSRLRQSFILRRVCSSLDFTSIPLFYRRVEWGPISNATVAPMSSVPDIVLQTHKRKQSNTGEKDAVTLLNRIRKKEYGSELKNAMGLRTHGFIP
jgi:hypothetical protein